ncbi:uncharacterized protein LOC110612284 isoform X2 [Manihot esculenta]|uniref:SNRNP25 ubiquitin-like domain-containing protein n=1 Tax=Manihot esculenta TaxID=3983 RepID=A0A2C9W643_MANES|nr:uncharacterized protein LOC110612284 isoform X2 [Manihot esculenta]
MSLLDMRIDVDGYLGPRRSNSLAFSPLMIIDGRSRNSNFSYAMLPEEPIKLTVLKLDGSCFDIEVMKSASIAELRQAVEAFFNDMPQKGTGKISWPHVWSHFCLTYEGQKLVTGTDYIKHYGIKDGDQLHFIRHISNSYTFKKKGSKKQTPGLEQHKISLSRLNIREDKEQDDKEESSHSIENRELGNFDATYQISEKHKESKWAGLLQRLFSCSRLQRKERSLKGSPSRPACRLSSGFRKIIKFCGDSNHPQRIEWREK